MLWLRRVKFFCWHLGVIIIPPVDFLAQSFDVPQPLAVRQQSLDHPPVGLAILIEHHRGLWAFGQPPPDPVEMSLFVPEENRQGVANRTGHAIALQFAGEVLVNSLFEDVRQREHFGHAARCGDLIEIERLVAAANPYGRQVECVDRPGPHPRVPRFVRAVPCELLDEVLAPHVPNHATQQQRTVELALPVPIQAPRETTQLLHGCPLFRSCAMARRSDV
jgi:hypothetical protein